MADAKIEPGDQAPWQWTGSRPSGTAAEVGQHDDLKVASNNGSVKDAELGNPAAQIAREGNDVVEKAHGVEVEEKAEHAERKDSAANGVMDAGLDTKDKNGESEQKPKETEEDRKSEDKPDEGLQVGMNGEEAAKIGEAVEDEEMEDIQSGSCEAEKPEDAAAATTVDPEKNAEQNSVAPSTTDKLQDQQNGATSSPSKDESHTPGEPSSRPEPANKKRKADALDEDDQHSIDEEPTIVEKDDTPQQLTKKQKTGRSGNKGNAATATPKNTNPSLGKKGRGRGRPKKGESSGAPKLLMRKRQPKPPPTADGKPRRSARIKGN